MDDRSALRQQIFRRKPAATLMSDAETHAGGLKRVLGALDLTLLGIGAIVGAGIFVMTGVGARLAGPRSRDGRPLLLQCAKRRE